MVGLCLHHLRLCLCLLHNPWSSPPPPSSSAWGTPSYYRLAGFKETLFSQGFPNLAFKGLIGDTFLRGTKFVKDAHGIAALSGMIPSFVSFVQAFAAVITTALIGSLYYITTAPKDPTYMIAPVTCVAVTLWPGRS